MYLTSKELTYLSDTDFLITKKRIQQKINDLLVRTEDTLKSYIRESSIVFPEGVSYKAGKMAKGENYRNLPYHILDYPRLFHRKDVFALRTMCWWGHFFSVTLHLQGRSWEQFSPNIRRYWEKLRQKDLYLCIHSHPWEYHREEDNFVSLQSLADPAVEQYLATMPFFKMAAFLPLNQGEQLPDFTLKYFQLFCEVLALGTLKE